MPRQRRKAQRDVCPHKGGSFTGIARHENYDEDCLQPYRLPKTESRFPKLSESGDLPTPSSPPPYIKTKSGSSASHSTSILDGRSSRNPGYTDTLSRLNIIGQGLLAEQGAGLWTEPCPGPGRVDPQIPAPFKGSRSRLLIKENPEGLTGRDKLCSRQGLLPTQWCRTITLPPLFRRAGRNHSRRVLREELEATEGKARYSKPYPKLSYSSASFTAGEADPLYWYRRHRRKYKF